MHKTELWRTVLFCLFAGAGFVALTVSILAGELLDLRLYGLEIQKAEQLNQRLQKLTAQYEAVIKQIEDDPNILSRLAGVSLGIEPNTADTAFPRVPEYERLVAEKILLEQLQTKAARPSPPNWLLRINHPWSRTIMFICSAGLIIVSFVCFGTLKKSPV
jgi:hypothetical protein